MPFWTAKRGQVGYSGRVIRGRKQTRKRTPFRVPGLANPSLTNAKRPYRKRVITKVVPKAKTQQPVKGMGSTSYFSTGDKAPKYIQMLKKLSGINKYELNWGFRVEANAGLQNAESYWHYDSQPLSQMFNTITAGNASKRLLLRSSNTNIQFSNCSNAVLYATIYDILCKREQAISSAYISPEQTWSAAEIQESNGLYALGNTMVGSIPTKFDLVNQFFKIEKVTTHLLQPGEVHNHQVRLFPNKMISANRMLLACRYAGLTRCTMIVVRGTPIDMTGVSDLSGNQSHYDASGNMQAPVLVGNTSITTSPCAVNVVFSTRYLYQWIADIDNDLTLTNNLQTTTDAGTDVMTSIGVSLPYTQT